MFSSTDKKEVDEQDKMEMGEVVRLTSQGHSHHCACRQVWGDGQCECDLYKRGYDPYLWIKSLTDPRNG